jgi:tetratricopeptide (TPR) repeat protein
MGLLLFVAMLSPPSFQEVYQHAQDAFVEGRFADVISMLADIPKEESRRPAPHNLRALALAELGHYDEALTANQRARELDPANSNYVYNEGLIYIAQADFRHAELVFRAALVQFPQSALLLEGLSEALIKQNRFDEAEESLNRAAGISPRSGSVYVAMARLYYSLGDGEKLGAAASQAITLEPGNYRACFYYGIWLLDYQNQLEAGARNIRKSIDLEPRFVDGLKTWGRIVSHEGRWLEAVHAYETAARIDSHDDQVFYLLSVAYRKVGQEQKADWALAQYRKLRKP